MNREWVTLAFGIVLVAAVAVISVWQNYPDSPADPVAVTPAPAAKSAPTPGAEPESTKPAPDTAAPAIPPAPAPQRRVAPAPPPPAVSTPPPGQSSRVNASLPVVHKHRFGDCEGTLRAVPGTLTYATANEEDAFRLAFVEIEEFELDEERKNLRVRRRGGRTWNFTTEGDNTAALAAFHKEASRARK